MKPNVKDLKYILLPGRFPKRASSQKIHNQAYLFWKNFWNKVFKDKQLDHEVVADNFWRQDIIAVVMHKNEIIGQILYSYYDLRSLTAQNHTYFINNYTEMFFDKLKAKNVNRIISVESLAVSPHWREKESGISLSTILISLGHRHVSEFEDAQAFVAAVRSHSSVPRISKELGADVLVENIKLYDEPAELIAFYKENLTAPSDNKTSFLVKTLWNQRQDLSNDVPRKSIKKAS